MAHGLGDRPHILWNTFVAQAMTPADRQSLMDREKAKYKITVPDAIFFTKSQ
jgi:hypothetical protein